MYRVDTDILQLCFAGRISWRAILFTSIDVCSFNDDISENIGRLQWKELLLIRLMRLCS
jgi:hypothetical protein